MSTTYIRIKFNKKIIDSTIQWNCSIFVRKSERFSKYSIHDLFISMERQICVSDFCSFLFFLPLFLCHFQIIHFIMTFTISAGRDIFRLPSCLSPSMINSWSIEGALLEFGEFRRIRVGSHACAISHIRMSYTKIED